MSSPLLEDSMKKLTFTGAFASYGAVPKNARWSCSAIAKDGALVFSGWKHLLHRYIDGHYLYKDELSRWGLTSPGARLLSDHLTQALENDLSLKLVLATAHDPNDILPHKDASKVQKTFSLRDDLVGRVVSFDGDSFVIA